MAELTVIAGEPAEPVFETLMGPHFGALYGRAYQLTGNAADAEDLVQDLCMRVFSRLDELRSRENPRAWLMHILYRLFVDLARRRQRSPLHSIETVNVPESALADGQEPGPEEHAEGMLTQRRLQRAWRYLSHEQRLLLVLHAIDGLSLAQIEKILRIPQGTLKSRLHRARARLGRLLDSQGVSQDPNVGGLDSGLPLRQKSVG